MALTDIIQGIRQEGYGEKKESKNATPGPSRQIKLTDDEKKYVEAVGPEGTEVSCQVTGRLNGDDFTITSVQAPEGGSDENQMAEDVMASNKGGAPLGPTPGMLR